ncbi:MAG: MotA/TolQ/ExbB proton channel family protein [Deltaproteobacteria bacterium]|nr:MotA/TolQ/ExbB proton channel family protein [Deltaproteobacteria bacterium]MBW1966088.1 MotA/TolQ/ExbB proton channel family protein [Deltaproteobacteria bacterium]MBW2097637.1 MotA/TolQ/ExbB proton channel family protein [Deltaproteobacteria bacterium]
MERKNFMGLIICLCLFISGFFLHGNIGLYFNLAGILIVVGGTLGATLISFRLKRLEILYKVLQRSYRTRVKEPHEIVEILVDLSVKSRLRGLLSLQEDEGETSILFLRRALGFLIDGYPTHQIKEILSTEMYFFKSRRYESERVLRTMAEICPSFGLVGSVVGLIGMLAGVGDQSVILATLPIALTSTLYGVVFANFLFLPLASRIRERTDRELLLQKIIMEGTIAIASKLNPRVLEMKLKSFLTPSLRKGRLVSLERIQKKFRVKAREAPNSCSTSMTAMRQAGGA